METIKGKQIDQKDISAAIKSGKVSVLPFDTVYGLVANPFDDAAIEKIYKIKGRDFDKPIALIFSSVEMLNKHISISPDQEKFITEKVPGAYTFILPWSAGDRTKFSSHYQKLEKIGIRIPNYEFILNLVEELGQPIAATSANVSNMPNCWKIDDFLLQIADQQEKPDLIVNAGELPKNPPSEVIDITDISSLKILRK
ncbi:MAG: L-threonylcarbamoyladenylate synthase [Candidatus Berkelbacteria bacterium]